MKVNGTNLTTPATVHLQRKRNYVVTIKKAGYETQTVELRKSLDGWFWGNLIIGGIPGWIIDGITGSASKLSPDIVSVTLQKVDIGDARKEEETMLQKEQSPRKRMELAFIGYMTR